MILNLYTRSFQRVLGGAVLLLSASSLPAFAAETASTKQELSLETIFASDTFNNRLPIDARWLTDSSGFTYIDYNSGDLMLYNAESISGKDNPVVLMSKQMLSKMDLDINSAQWSDNNQYALLNTGRNTTWNGYVESSYQVYDRERDQFRKVAQGSDLLRQVHLSPSGEHLAYVLHNNLYVEDIKTGAVQQITDDGSKSIFNGIFDYGSTEFGKRRAWHWSPDGQKIAFWKLDASEVPEYPLMDDLGNYSKVNSFHYPNAGNKHAINRIGVYSLNDKNTRWLNTEIDPDDYLPTLDWGTESQYLFVQHLARDQNTLRLLRFNLNEKGFDVPVIDKDPAWIDITDDFTSVTGGEDFLWTSERSGYRHIYRYHKGKLHTLTEGNWSVDAIVGVDTISSAVYFYAKKDSLIDQYVYRVSITGGQVERVSSAPGWHQWQLSPDGTKAITLHSDAKTPPKMGFRDLSKKQAETVIAKNEIPGMRSYAMTHTEFITFETRDGIELNGYFIKPPNFDPSKQYPLIAYAYGNAGSQIVVNRWGTQRGPTQDLWHRYLAQQGYVVFAMDNRTTTGRGKKAKNLTYGHYGKYAVSDELEGVAFLKTLPWIDSDRLGFWGWSGGGYLAAAMMTKGAPHFKVGASVAPVIDLTRYQAVGVERWMGSPEENPEGYQAVNLMNDADKLEGKLLLIHGTGDENVKYAFTLQFAESLINANKQFDMLIYPNQRHTIADKRLHVFSTITRYFNEHL